jgi:hypothetical protein
MEELIGEKTNIAIIPKKKAKKDGTKIINIFEIPEIFKDMYSLF